MKVSMKYAMIIASVLIIQIGNAQNIKVKFGREYEPFKPRFHWGDPIFVGEKGQLTEDAEYTYNRQMKSDADLEIITIIKQTKGDEKIIWEKKLPAVAYDKKQNRYFCKLKKTSKGFLMFLKKNDLNKKESLLLVQQLDENLNAIGEIKTVMNSKRLDKTVKMASNPYDFIIRQTGPRFLVYGYYSEHIQLQNVPYTFTTIDENGDSIWTKEIILPADKYFDPKDAVIDKDANLTALFQVSKDDRKMNIETAEHLAFHYDYKQDKVLSQAISGKGKYKRLLQARYDMNTESGKGNIYGLYQNDLTNSDGEGIFTTTFDIHSLEIVSSDTIAFPAEIMSRLEGLKGQSFSKGVADSNMLLRKKIEQDGHTLFLIEDYFKTSTETSTPVYGLSASMQATSGGQSHSTTYQYHYNDAFIISVDGQNKLEWCYCISKNQVTTSDISFFSVYAFMQNDLTYLLFNAEEKSVMDLAKFKGYQFKRWSKDPIVLVTLVLDKNGKLIESKNITSSTDKTMICNLNRAQKLNDGKLKLIFEKRNAFERIEIEQDALLEVE